MRSLIVEGILSIQAGDNPRVVQEKLITFVPPSPAPRRGRAAAAARARPRRRPRNPSWPDAGGIRAGHHEEEHENEERWLVSFADMMTLLFCLFMVLFAISSVNTSKFEALQKSLQDAFSGAVLSGGKAVMASGSSDGTAEGRAAAAAAVAAPADRDQRHERAVRRRARGQGPPGGAGLPRAQAADRQPRQGRRPAGQGEGHRAPPRPGHPAAHRQGLLRFGRRDAQAGRAQAGRQDRRRRARRAQAPGRRRRPHRLAADLRLAVPLQLGAVRRSRRRGRPRFRRQRRPRPPGLPLRFRLSGADRLEFAPRKGVRRTDGSRSSSPASTPTRSHNPAHGGAQHHGQEDRSSHRRPARSRRRLQVRHRQAAGRGQAQAQGPRHRLHAPEGVPRQPARGPLREAPGRPRSWPTTTSPPSPPAAATAPPRPRPRATAR